MIALVLAAMVSGFLVGSYRRRRCSRRDHEPRALQLARRIEMYDTIDPLPFPTPRSAAITRGEYVETAWGEDVLSIPRSIPGPPKQRLG